MKKALSLLIVLMSFMQAMAQQHVENKYLSMELPDGWITQKQDLNMFDMLVFMNDGTNVYNMGMIIGLEMPTDPKSAIENQILLKESNIILKDATFGDIRKTTFMQKPAYTSDIATTFMGNSFKGAMYCFEEGGCTFVTMGFYKDGCKSDLPKVWRTIKWKKIKKDTEKYMNLREEVKDLCETLNKLNAQGNGLSAEGVKLLSMNIAEDEDCIIYKFQTENINAEDLDQETREVMIEVMKATLVESLKQEIAKQPVLQRCVDENYSFRYDYYDSNMEKFISITLTSDELK